MNLIKVPSILTKSQATSEHIGYAIFMGVGRIMESIRFCITYSHPTQAEKEILEKCYEHARCIPGLLKYVERPETPVPENEKSICDLLTDPRATFTEVFTIVATWSILTLKRNPLAVFRLKPIMLFRHCKEIMLLIQENEAMLGSLKSAIERVMGLFVKAYSAT